MAADSHSVALQNPGEKEWNCLAVPGIDIVVPLHEDLDCDPFQDDEIRLQSLAGGYEKIVRSSSPDATPDHDSAMIYYRFRAVPTGLYSIAVRIHGHWVDISHSLIVTPKGVWLGDTRLDAEPSRRTLRPRQVSSAPPPALPPVAPRYTPRYPDQSDNRFASDPD